MHCDYSSLLPCKLAFIGKKGLFSFHIQQRQRKQLQQLQQPSGHQHALSFPISKSLSPRRVSGDGIAFAASPSRGSADFSSLSVHENATDPSSDALKPSYDSLSPALLSSLQTPDSRVTSSGSSLHPAQGLSKYFEEKPVNDADKAISCEPPRKPSSVGLSSMTPLAASISFRVRGQPNNALQPLVLQSSASSLSGIASSEPSAPSSKERAAVTEGRVKNSSSALSQSINSNLDYSEEEARIQRELRKTEVSGRVAVTD